MLNFLNQKPLISNQHGALAMAFVPFLYGIFAGKFSFLHIWLGLSWLGLYLFSYPFLALFSRKNTQLYRQWAIFYLSLSLLFSLPIILSQPTILQFLLPIIPLAIIQIYYVKQRDERNILNDIAGFLIFGVVGMASYYLTMQDYSFVILLHPTLSFIATTFYVKSVARERKNPHYVILSLIIHLLFGIGYFLFELYSLSLLYIIGLLRAIIVPKLKLNIKQIGLLEFPILFLLLISLYTISN